MDRRVQHTINLISENLCHELSVSALAEEVNLSPSRLHHLFKDQMGCTPAQYHKRIRMHMARELAETTFLNLKQIMATVGATDKSHFIRDYKREHGSTITQHRTDGFRRTRRGDVALIGRGIAKSATK